MMKWLFSLIMIVGLSSCYVTKVQKVDVTKDYTCVAVHQNTNHFTYTFQAIDYVTKKDDKVKKKKYKIFLKTTEDVHQIGDSFYKPAIIE